MDRIAPASTVRRLTTVGLAVVTIALFVGSAPAPAAAQGLDLTCSLSLLKIDADTLNVAYPDQAAIYYTASYSAAPGTRIRISGTFPHSRYTSFNVYDPAQRPLDAIADREIVPDPGSANPFISGARRDTPDAGRRYTVFIDFGPRPAHPAANTIYTGSGQNGTPNFTGTFIYRIYIPDRGRDDLGGVGLPTAELEPTTSATPGIASPCTNVTRPPSPVGVNQQLGQANGQPALETSGTSFGQDPPHWRKFVNLFSSVDQGVTDNPTLGPPAQPVNAGLDPDSRGGNGGFLSNLHNAYVAAFINRGYGQVVATRIRVASFPDTRPGTAVMPGGQLRYWSMCQNDPQTQRFVACATDDQTVLRDGFATFVVSTPQQRPANATAACGVNWLPWGANARGVLILRNMLPAPDFAQAIQRATPDRETATMGDYFPRSAYTDTHGYDALGCAGAASASAFSRLRGARCVDRRSFTIPLPYRRSRGRVVRAEVFVGARRVRRLRGRNLRRVTLTGLPLGSFTIRVVARTVRGVRLTSIRSYRGCRQTPRRERAPRRTRRRTRRRPHH